MGEVKTSSLISRCCIIGLCVTPRALAVVTAHRARAGRTLPVHGLAWATQRPPPWASQLDFCPLLWPWAAMSPEGIVGFSNFSLDLFN
jgi:hypothetical protein